ncbi:MAG: ribosome silencing factor [Deltaproteobacteria bacterium]|nr:ribosome silencing factor [Deltaproteobacteria bacterium]
MKFTLDKQARDVQVLDVAGLCTYTDVLVVCHGTSSRQAQTIVRHVREQMKKIGEYAIGTEGEAEGQWVVIDYGDIVLHTFYAPVREYYGLEGIWPDARRGFAEADGDGVRIEWRRRRKKAAGETAETAAKP